jgi:hypothetical protein
MSGELLLVIHKQGLIKKYSDLVRFWSDPVRFGQDATLCARSCCQKFLSGGGVPPEIFRLSNSASTALSEALVHGGQVSDDVRARLMPFVLVKLVG